MPNTKSVGVAFSDPALDGAVMGATGGTAGFFGVTPVAQQTLTTLNLGALNTTATGFLTTTQISALTTSLNGVITSLKTLGLSS